MKKEIRPLTGLRGLAAMWVVAHHAMKFTHDIDGAARAPLALLGKAGYLGVDLFFVLSGFVIALSYQAELHRSAASYRAFLWKRLARIYPVHIAAVAIFAATLALHTPDIDLSISGLIATLTLTHAWAVPIDLTWHSVSWSISAEWAAYLCFPLIALATKRATPMAALCAIAALFGLLSIAIAIGPWRDGYAYGMHRIAVEFTAGVLLFRLWAQHKVAINRGTCLALAGLLIGANVLDGIAGSGTAQVALPILACVVVYGLACADGWLASAFARLEHLGHISYSLYLVHMLVFALAIAAIESVGLNRNVAAVYGAIALSVALSLLASEAMYRFVEKPARTWMLGSGVRHVNVQVP